MKLQNMLFNTDYPVDKIVFLKEVTLTPSGGVFQATIAHNLDSVPFCSAVATKDDWVTTYPSGYSESGGQYYIRRFLLYSDATNIYIYGFLEDTVESPSSDPVTIRICGFYNESDTFNATASSTSSRKSLWFDTDYNYPSLVQDGIVDVSGTSQSVSHNLGYVPFVQVWALETFYYPVSGTYWSELTTNDYDTSEYYPAFTIDSSNLTFNLKSSSRSITKFYYRIYGHDSSL